ncbi:MAG: phosphate ABC transporter substrate-binding protein [Thioalkalispiraceae bacterium]|jgi:phosphate transport system substrate-binding protein
MRQYLSIITATAVIITTFGSFWPGTAPRASANSNDSIQWAGCGITKKAFMKELATAFERKTKIKVNLNGGGATKGIRDTAALKVDMGGSCRMTLPEVERKELHVSLHPVAWDALAVIVHPENPVQTLSTEQVKGIYLGKITNWQQVGGANKPIKLYARRGKHSGVGYAIRQYLFKDSNTTFVTPNMVRSSGPLEKAVEKDVTAMGITGISSARKRKVKIIGFDGRTPDYESIKNGSYGLYRPLYLVTSPKPSNRVKEFISFAQSADGRKIIRENGTVPYRDALGLMSKLILYGFDVK